MAAVHSDTPFASLCQGRFSSLEPLLKNVYLGDWVGLTLTEVLPMFDVGHRPLVAAFFRFLERDGLFEAATSTEGGTLNLSGAVTSKLYGQGARSLDKFVDQKNLGVIFDNVTTIDLRFCSLLDIDAVDVVQLVEKAIDGGAHNLIVDLSGNRFTAKSFSTFLHLCSFSDVRFVVVPEIGNTEATEEISQAPVDSLSKMIFIRETHLTGKNWHLIVPAKARSSVEAAHKQYYSIRGGYCPP